MTGLLTCRPAAGADETFLRDLYATTRAAELARVPWSDAEKAAFVAMQFRAQDQHYRAHYANAAFDVVLLDDHPIGRLYVDRGAEEIRIVDLSLLPAHRGRGIGTALLSGLQAEAARAGKVLSIHVEHANPAQRLYRRLGFTEAGDRGVYLYMEWRPREEP